MKKRSEVLSELVNNKFCEGDEEFVDSKFYNCSTSITREHFDIVNQAQSNFYKKEIGQYEILSIPDPLLIDSDDEGIIISELCKIFGCLLGRITSKSKVLVVGLGNRHISADSLGTAICKKINITLKNKYLPQIMAICPSVMGLTGIETYEIVRGVIDRIKPTHLILIDSLCAGDESRLCKSIQITDTGVCPGSGIGNKRKCIDKSLAPVVVSIGVPLLIYSSTFIDGQLNKYNINQARITSIMQRLKKVDNNETFINLLDNMKSLIKCDNFNTIVTVKDIEESVEILSNIIAKSINISLNVSELKKTYNHKI